MKVFISGNFNVVHPGHIRLFKKARELGSTLIIGVNSSSASGNIELFPDDERVDAVGRNSLVDNVVLINRPLSEILQELNPDIIVKGTEFEGKPTEEAEYALKNNKLIIYSDGDPLFSESDLIRDSSHVGSHLVELSKLLLGVGFNKDRLSVIMDRIRQVRVTIIGDFIIDEYINCEPLGLSQEDANVVLKPIDSAIFLGGAAIVARHARGLGANVTYLTSVSRTGEHLDLLQNTFDKEGINLEFVEDAEKSQIVKKRFRVDGTSRFRLTEGSMGELSKVSQNEMLRIGEKLSKESNLVVFSDFNYGVISQSLPAQLLQNRRPKTLFAADNQISSQIGDLTKYHGIDFLSATEFEARVSMNSRNLGLAKLITYLRKSLNVNNCILKLGRDGLIYESDNEQENPKTGAMPALNSRPVDVAGAGDSLLAASALALTAGATLHEASILGSIAAAVQVGRIGNFPVTSDQILTVL